MEDRIITVVDYEQTSRTLRRLYAGPPVTT